MNTEYFTEMHKLIERAKALEKMGREEDALNTYLEIHARFFPNTSDLYERPAILLEKRKRFDEAITICEKAVKLIGEGKITGVKSNFERRIDRIKSRSSGHKEEANAHKADTTHQAKSENVAKVEKPVSEKHKFTLIRSEKAHKEKPEKVRPVKERQPITLPKWHIKAPKSLRVPKIDWRAILQKIIALVKAFIIALKNLEIKAILILCLILASIFGFFFALSQLNTDKYDVFIKMSDYKNNGASSKPLTAEELAKLPVITEDMILIAKQSLSQMPAVKDAGIVIHEDMLGFVIKLNPGASQSEAKVAAETFVRALATAAAGADQLRAPNNLSYGELYNYYGAVVVVGEDPKHVALTGYKFSKALGFTWKENQ